MSDCTSLRQKYQCKRNCAGLRKIEPVQKHIKPELQHIHVPLKRVQLLGAYQEIGINIQIRKHFIEY